MNSLYPPNATPFEKSISSTIDLSTAIEVPVRKLWSPQTCPIEVIAWLGWALSVDDWDPNWTEVQKRNAVENSIQVHRQKGTVGAVKRAVGVLGFDVEVDERTGQVYTFNVRLKSKPGLAPTIAQMDEAERLALGAKNVRSHLANVGVLNESEGAIKVSAAEISGEMTIIWPEIVDEVIASPSARFLAAEQTIEVVSIAPYFETELVSTINHAVAAVASYSITLTASNAA